MTLPVTRAIAVNCLLYRISERGATMLVDDGTGHVMTVFKCTECGNPILPEQTIQFDAVHAHTLGGEHGFKDLRPIHYDPCHKAKSARDVAANAKGKRLRGETCTKPSKKIASKPFDKRNTRKFNGQVVPRTPVQSST